MPHFAQTSYFEYWDEAPHNWQSLMHERVERGESLITIPIMWGVHEPTPGMRDFSKQSKLRIERLLTAAQGAGANIRILLGFPPHPLAFPSWSLGESCHELVPKLLWDGVPPYFSLIQLPSLRSRRLMESFVAYFEEVSSIVSLYLAPEGPISEVELALQPLGLSQSISEDSNYYRYLEKRYPDVSVLNKRFQTHFKEVNSVATPSGKKLIENKRPWLFAYDYQWARAKIVDDCFREILGARLSESLTKMIKVNGGLNFPCHDNINSRAVCFESTLIQHGTQDLISPLMIQGQISGAAVQAFQWGQMVAETAKSNGLQFLPLFPLETEMKLPHSALTIFCGKYLSACAGKALMEKLNSGCALFFPMGLPQYDENLDSHEFSLSNTRKALKIGGFEWFYAQKNKGQIFYPAQSSTFFSPENIKSWLSHFSQDSEELIRG